MSPEELVDRHPTLFHMARADAWDSIQRHGLLSTRGLADLYGLEGRDRQRLLTQIRTSSFTLQARAGLDPVTIRDQKPMKFIRERIEPGSTLELYLEAINSRVFFWPSRERLNRLLSAREYIGQAHVILHVDTRSLVATHADRIELCRFNSGAVLQKNHPYRGHQSWIPIDGYPYAEYTKRHGSSSALAEVTIAGDLQDALSLTSEIEHVPGRTPQAEDESSARPPSEK